MSSRTVLWLLGADAPDTFRGGQGAVRSRGYDDNAPSYSEQRLCIPVWTYEVMVQAVERDISGKSGQCGLVACVFPSSAMIWATVAAIGT